MADNLNIDEALEEYGYSKENKKHMLGYIALALLLLFATIGAAIMGKMWSDERSKSLRSEQSFRKASEKLSEMEVRNAELASQIADKQAEIERLKNDFVQLEADHKEQLQRTFAQMNEIVYDSKKTLNYINGIETRLRKGQRIDKEEAAKLANVVNGLSFLHEQYKKPISEFRELDQYFQKQLDAIPRGSAIASSRPTSSTASVAVSRPDPSQTTSVLKKIFQNKKYKQDRDAYLQEKGRAAGISQGIAQGRYYGRQEGKREALTQARQVVQQAYARAQKQMGELQIDKDQYLAQLNELVASNQQSAEDVEDFFEKSKEILKIHDTIMNVEPTKVDNIQP